MIWFLHIPHTGGRGLGRFLWCKEIPHLKIHNGNDFLNAHINVKKDKIPDYKYFILRDPIERGYKEFLHYSSRLDVVDTVNHLNISDILKKNPNFNHKEPKDYFGLEINRNLLCKFLLEKEDFSIPLTEKEYCSININNFIFDFFTDLPNLPNLRKILNTDIIVPNIGNSQQKEVPLEIKKIIEQYNNFDLMLFSQF